MKQLIIDPNKSYTFSDYFNLKIATDDLLDYFGYSLTTEFVELPQLAPHWQEIETIKKNMFLYLPKIQLGGEIAKREALIAPILLTLATHLDIQLRFEYSVIVSEQLKGTIDYYIRSPKAKFLVIEAKKDSLEDGFKQLAVEMIAVQQLLETERVIYGAISTGQIWEFGILEPATHKITQDLNLYQIPRDVETLFAVLVRILKGELN